MVTVSSVAARNCRILNVSRGNVPADTTRMLLTTADNAALWVDSQRTQGMDGSTPQVPLFGVVWSFITWFCDNSTRLVLYDEGLLSGSPR